ncbi:MAG: hypothetical protein WC205_07505 [Opitutaceae bacterium]|jgi:hypothetical protein
MSSSRSSQPAISRPQGVLVWLLVGLVLTLALLTSSPSLHARLHHQDHATPAAHDDSGCAITLFQHGVTTPLDLPRVEIPADHWIATQATDSGTLPLSSPPHLLQPARGPPGIG